MSAPVHIGKLRCNVAVLMAAARFPHLRLSIPFGPDPESKALSACLTLLSYSGWLWKRTVQHTFRIVSAISLLVRI